MAIPTQMQFNDMIDKLTEIIEFYNSTPYRFNQIKLNLSNGKIINFSFHKARIAHLLGINVAGFQNYKILSSTDAYGILEEISRRGSYIYQKCLRGEISYSDLFSKYMPLKLESFKHIFMLPFQDIEFVCEYNPNNAYLAGNKLSHPCNYYIALSNGEDYDFLGLKFDEKTGQYFTVSNITTTKGNKEQILQSIVSNQRITLVNCYEFINMDHKKALTLKEKSDKLSNLLVLANENGATLDVANEALYLLRLSRGLAGKSDQLSEQNNREATVSKEKDILKELKEVRRQLHLSKEQILAKDREIASLKEALKQLESQHEKIKTI